MVQLSDSQRDEQKYVLLITVLEKAVREFRQVEEAISADVDQTLKRLLPAITKAFAANHAFVIVSEPGQSDRMEFTYVSSAPDLEGETLEVNDILREVFKTGDRQVVGGQQIPDLVNELRIDLNSSIVLVRMETTYQTRLVGLTKTAHDIGSAFLGHDALALDNLTEFIAIGARLGERRGRELQSIQQSAASLTTSLLMEEVLDQIINTVFGAIACQKAAVFLCNDSDPSTASVARSRGLSDQYQAASRSVPINATSRVRAIYTGDLTHIPDMNTLALNRENLELSRQEGFQAIIDVPMQLDGTSIGLISVYFEQPHKMTRLEEEILRTFAHHATIAVQNAKLYEDLQNSQGQIGSLTILAWMGMVSSIWHHKLTGFAITIKKEADRLMGKTDESSLIDRLKVISELAAKISASPITPPLSGADGVQKLPVNMFIKNRISGLLSQPKYRIVVGEYKLPDRATIKIAPEWLREALDILIDNAIAAVDNSPRKKVTVSTSRQGEWAIISVSDTGPGIPQEIREKLFFERIEDSDGLGVGLLIAQVITKAYGGSIDIPSYDEDGTTVRLLFPLTW